MIAALARLVKSVFGVAFGSRTQPLRLKPSTQLANRPKDLPWPWNNILAPLPSQKEGGVVGFPDAARSRHFVVFGQSGAGKSRFLESLILMDVIRRAADLSKRGVCCIDVHGSLNMSLRSRISVISQQFPIVDQL